MERHISAECSVMTGKSGRTRSQPVCARGKCGKVLYAPIACSVRRAPPFFRVYTLMLAAGLQEAVLSAAPLPKGSQLLEPYVVRGFVQVAQHVFMGCSQAPCKDFHNADIEYIQFSRQSSAFIVGNINLFKYCRIEQPLLKD